MHPLINNIHYAKANFLLPADFEPPQEASPPQVASPGGGSKISVGVLVGIVAGGTFIVLLIFGILWRNGFLRREKTLEQGICSWFVILCLEFKLFSLPNLY